MVEDKVNDRYPLWFKIFDVLHWLFRHPQYRINRNPTNKFDKLRKMDYRECRKEEISNGDLLFCGGNYWFSKVIRYLSGKSKASHVGIIYWWNGRLMLLESVEGKGVRIVPVSQYLENYNNTHKPYDGRVYLGRHKKLYIAPNFLDRFIKMPFRYLEWQKGSENETAVASRVRNPQVEQLLGTAATLLNKKFSLCDTFHFFIQGITGRLSNKDNDEYLCSEFVAKCFKTIGIEFESVKGFIAPEHIAASDDVEILMEITSIKK